MDLMKIGLYALAGYGAYSLYERMNTKETTTTETTNSFTGTNWQRRGGRP